jgi:hypothetical protein
MNRKVIRLFVTLSIVSFGAKATAAVITPTALDAVQVTIAGMAVTAIVAGTVYNGCYIQNDPNATTSLVVDPVNTANYTTPASTASFVLPGGVYICPGSVSTAVTVNSSDSTHKFYGVKY